MAELASATRKEETFAAAWGQGGWGGGGVSNACVEFIHRVTGVEYFFLYI